MSLKIGLINRLDLYICTTFFSAIRSYPKWQRRAKNWPNWQRSSKKFRERWLKLELEGIKSTLPDGTVRAEGAHEKIC